MIHGLDVSSYQPEQFPLTTPGGKPVDFVIIKATQGIGYTNPKLQAQLDWARQNGLSVGFYHFGDAGSIDKQVEFFLATVRPRLRLGDHLWFDWEKPGISNDDKDAWIRQVQQAEPEHRVGLYCNRDFWLNRDTTSFAGDGLWIADWAANPPAITADWAIHQHTTDRGIDEDVADFESRAAMKAWAGDVSTSNDGLDYALGVIAQGIADVLNVQHRVEDKVDQLARQIAAEGAEWSTQISELKAAIAKLQTGQNGLVKKVADELNRRLAK
jgi:hypothetical protein